MKTNLKIRIANEAFDFINKLLEFHSEYDCISLKEAPSTGCCKNPKIDISLDNMNKNSITENIHGLNIAYNDELSNNFKDVVIVLNNSNLYLKATPTITTKHKNCSGCNSCSGSCKSSSK